MGYIKHEALIVISYSEEVLSEIHLAATVIYADKAHLISPIIDSRMNGYHSFFIAPDGSKEGWTDSNASNAARNLVVSYIEKQNNTDYCEVMFGGDDPHIQAITRPTKGE